MRKIKTAGRWLRGSVGWAVLVLASWFPLVIPVAATPAAAADACVACHTDAGKLKALTPPDPPSAETGEG
jgi:mono/diheme cytochrome c family protein